MIKDLGELEQLLKLLRSQGVMSFDWGTLSIELGDLPGEVIQESEFIDMESEPKIPTQSELDIMVNMPVGGIDDPFLDYNNRDPQE
jgi:hypothetical protein